VGEFTMRCGGRVREGVVGDGVSEGAVGDRRDGREVSPPRAWGFNEPG
jgi:hypothetical protein